MLSNKQGANHRVFKYRNILGKNNLGEKIVLLSEHRMKKFDVFLDKEIGIPKYYQNKIQEVDVDEDFESSDQIVDFGINKCLTILHGKDSQEELGQRFTTQEEYDTKSTVKAQYGSQKTSRIFQLDKEEEERSQ